jgi:REP element-mobilizing transposase RayT
MFSIEIGGVEDHVHVLASFARMISIAGWVKELKRVSNPWIKEHGIEAFQWQAGYAAFSVSKSNLERVKEYIATQGEHHQKMSFQDELREMFRKHGVQFDERYVWD